jgi:hypothetical protein
MTNDVVLNVAKNLPCDAQMLHFVQHDNPSNKLRQTAGLSRFFVGLFLGVGPF